MRYFKSEEKAYNPANKKYIPVWKLDAVNCIVTHFNKETSELQETVYETDFIRYHIHYSMNKYPSRLKRLVNSGEIIDYLNDLEERVNETIDRQVEHWKKSDKEYQEAVAAGDIKKAAGLENMLTLMAREPIFEAMVYV